MVSEKEGKDRLWTGASAERMEVDANGHGVCGSGTEWCIMSLLQTTKASSHIADPTVRTAAENILASAAKALEAELDALVKAEEARTGVTGLAAIVTPAPSGPELMFGRHAGHG